MTNRLLTALALAGAAWLTAAVPATATAAWPERPVQMIVPYPPGGATDVIGRMLAPRLSTALGQQVVVENRAAPVAISAPRRSRRRLPTATRC